MTGVELFAIGSTVVTLADAIAVAGAVTGAVGAISSATASANAAEFNAEQAALDAEQSREAAAREQEIADQDAKDFRRRNSRILAASRARRAGSGITNQGTSLLVDEATAAEIELGAQNILAGGASRSAVLEQEAGRFEGEAALNRSKSKSARSSGALSAGTTLLTGLGSTFG